MSTAIKPAESVNTAPVVAAGLLGGYITARESGIRPLGGVVLGAAGLYWAGGEQARTVAVVVAMLVATSTAVAGPVTFLGLLAIGWSLLWRARSALIQGLFLGALGLGVLASTIYRMIVQLPPEAELMGLFGIVALVVNVLAAAVLIPHRTGDANVRAVWLFSRNDAIGNLAVVIAAGLVAWLGSAWPDLIVAFAIAGLFLHSSWMIIRDARSDLVEAD